VIWGYPSQTPTILTTTKAETFERGQLVRQLFNGKWATFVVLERLTSTTFRVVPKRWWHFLWLPR
jgi:hypothetical protein